MAVRRRDGDYHTFRDYLIWSNTFGDELIDGAAYVREPPAPSWSHQAIVAELCFQLSLALKGTSWHVCVAPLDIRLPKSAEQQDDQVDTVVQPDVCIVGDLRKVDSRGVRGAPDWLAEVLSPSTATYDRNKKIPVYERAGVPEVWLINPADRTVAIYKLEEGRYGHPTTLGLQGQTQLTAVSGVIIEWDPVVARIV